MVCAEGDVAAGEQPVCSRHAVADVSCRRISSPVLQPVSRRNRRGGCFLDRGYLWIGQPVWGRVAELAPALQSRRLGGFGCHRAGGGFDPAFGKSFPTELLAAGSRQDWLLDAVGVLAGLA